MSEAKGLARVTPLVPQRLGFLPTLTFWRQPGALDNARWLIIGILVVGALPFAASGLPPTSSFFVFGGLCYLGLGILERYARVQAIRRSGPAFESADLVDETERRGAGQGRGGCPTAVLSSSVVTKEDLLTAVLSLPAPERAELARELLRSLDERGDEAQALWVEEVTRRAREVAEGTVSTVDWADARERIRNRLEQRRDDRASSGG